MPLQVRTVWQASGRDLVVCVLSDRDELGAELGGMRPAMTALFHAAGAVVDAYGLGREPQEIAQAAPQEPAQAAAKAAPRSGTDRREQEPREQERREQERKQAAARRPEWEVAWGMVRRAAACRAVCDRLGLEGPQDDLWTLRVAEEIAEQIECVGEAHMQLMRNGSGGSSSSSDGSSARGAARTLAARMVARAARARQEQQELQERQQQSYNELVSLVEDLDGLLPGLLGVEDTTRLLCGSRWLLGGAGGGGEEGGEGGGQGAPEAAAAVKGTGKGAKGKGGSGGGGGGGGRGDGGSRAAGGVAARNGGQAGAGVAVAEAEWRPRLTLLVVECDPADPRVLLPPLPLRQVAGFAQS